MPESPPSASSVGSSDTDVPAPAVAAPGSTVAPSAGNAATRATPPLWRAMDEATVNTLPEYAAHWSEEGRALVGVEGAVAASRPWRVGNRLTIPLP